VSSPRYISGRIETGPPEDCRRHLRFYERLESDRDLLPSGSCPCQEWAERLRSRTFDPLRSNTPRSTSQTAANDAKVRIAKEKHSSVLESRRAHSPRSLPTVRAIKISRLTGGVQKFDSHREPQPESQAPRSLVRSSSRPAANTCAPVSVPNGHSTHERPSTSTTDASGWRSSAGCPPTASAGFGSPGSTRPARAGPAACTNGLS